MARASAAAAAVSSAAARLWTATANPDGPGLLERGREFQHTGAGEFHPVAADGVVRLARLAQQASTYLRDCPDADVRRSAALLAARAHPVLAAFDESA